MDIVEIQLWRCQAKLRLPIRPTAAAMPMKDKTSDALYPNKLFVTAEDPSTGFGSYGLGLISFGLIVALKTLISILRPFARQDAGQQLSDYFRSSVSTIACLGSRAVALALSLFSFTVAFVHFRDMRWKNNSTLSKQRKDRPS